MPPVFVLLSLFPGKFTASGFNKLVSLFLSPLVPILHSPLPTGSAFSSARPASSAPSPDRSPAPRRAPATPSPVVWPDAGSCERNPTCLKQEKRYKTLGYCSY